MLSAMISVMRQFRVLQKHWLLALIAVFSLSIAMGLGVLSLSLINHFLFVPPTGQDPGRLVVIHARTPETPIEKFSYLDYGYYRENNQVFTDVAAMPEIIGFSFTAKDGTQISVAARPVSDNYFEVLGIRPFMGRLLSPGDDRSPTSLAVMTYSCWQRFSADPNILGKNISGSIIIGVTPKEFVGSMWGVNADLLTSLPQNDAEFFTKRKYRAQLLLARLKPGVTRRKAQAEMSTLAKQLASASGGRQRSCPGC